MTCAITLHRVEDLLAHIFPQVALQLRTLRRNIQTCFASTVNGVRIYVVQAGYAPFCEVARWQINQILLRFLNIC